MLRGASARATEERRPIAHEPLVSPHTYQQVQSAVSDENLHNNNNGDGEERDQFGLPPYHPVHHRAMRATLVQNGGEGAEALRWNVPWELRDAEHADGRCESFLFVGTAEFWGRVEFAVRTAIMAVLPACVVLYTTWDEGPWISQTFLISGALLATSNKDTFGLQVSYVGQYLRSSVVWLAVVVAATELEVYRSTAAWVCVYFVSVFCFAALMESFARSVALLLFTVAFMNLIRSESNNAAVPFRVCGEWALGIGFSMVSVLLPWPQLSKQRASKTIVEIGHNVATAWRGLASTFWTPTNLQRSVGMIRVRFLLRRVDDSTMLAKQHLAAATYEWILETPSHLRLRQLKFALLVDVARELGSMRRVVELVQDRPFVLEGSVRAQLFGVRLNPTFEQIAATADHLLHFILQTPSRRAIVASPLFDQLAALQAELQQNFHDARREYFYETDYNNLEEFVPLMTYYFFCTEQVCRAVHRLRETLQQELSAADTLPHWRHLLLWTSEFFASPLRETYRTAHQLLFRRNHDDVRVVIEAAKIAGSMVASIGFYFYMDAPTAFLSGPTVIAFVVSSNPAEALNSSIPRLTGALFGVALGFFVSSTASDNVSRVAGLVTIVFVARLVAHVRNIGAAMGYAAFTAVTQLSITPLSSAASLSRMQQTTFAITIYVLVTMFVFPCRATRLVKERRTAIVLQLSQLFSCVMNLFVEVATVYENHRRAVGDGGPTAGLEGGKAGADVISDAVIGEDDNSESTERAHRPLPARSTSALISPTANLATSFASSFIEFPQQSFDHIQEMITALEHEIAVVQRIMPFAADEPRMSSAVYQTRACEHVQVATVKLLALLRTMAQSVKLLRQRRDPPSLELTQMLQHLVPVARDAVVEMEMFCTVLTVLIREQNGVDVTPELMKRSQALSVACNELHMRKSSMLLRVIQNARRTYRASLLREQHHPPAPTTTTTMAPYGIEPVDSPAARESSSFLNLRGVDVDPSLHAEIASPAATAAVGGSLIAPNAEGERSLLHRSRVLGSVLASGGGAGGAVGPFRRCASDGEIMLGFQGDGTVRYQEIVNASVASQHHQDHVQRIHSSLRPTPLGDTTAAAVSSVISGRIAMPATFQLPVTVQDAEGIHSLTFSVVLFSLEMRKMLLAVEDLQQQ